MEFTIPVLQAHLDRMAPAKSLSLTSDVVERLFGSNDIARAQVKRFARGHDCVVAYTDGSVVFHKLPPGFTRTGPASA